MRRGRVMVGADAHVINVVPKTMPRLYQPVLSIGLRVGKWL